MIEVLALAGKALATFFRVIGVRGCIIVALLLTIAGIFGFYQGVPLVRDIPFINYIPGIGDVAIGRVQVRVNAAVDGARHAFAVESDNIAKKAQADAEAESARQAAVVANEFNARLASYQVSQAQTSKDLADAIAKNALLLTASGYKPAAIDSGSADILRKQGFHVDR